MSLYDSASLVMIPSGVKDTKAYSIKPTDGSGDFTFSRGSDIQATRVNSSGLIEKAKENNILQSNQFDTTWLQTNTTLTSGQSGYDGSSDAWLLSKSASYGQIGQSISSSGVNTFSVYAKEGTSGWIRLVAIGTANPSAYFNLSNGNVGVTANIISSNSENIGGGWYRYSISINQSSITEVRVYPAEGDNDISGTSGNIYIQDAALCHGLVAQDYVETTTTAVVEGLTADLPRLDYSGGASCPSLLLEPSRTNIHTNSEYVDAYVKSRSTITTNATTSPEGVSNASKVIPLSTSTGWAGVNAPNHSFTSGDTYTLSVFAKAGEYNYCQVGGSTPAFNGSFATINLTNGVVEHQSGITATTEDYGSGWWRISFTHTAIATASSPIGFFAVYSTAVSSRLATQVGDDTSGVYMYGWQAEQGSYPTSYIPTYGTAAVRGADSCSKTGVSSLLNDSEGTLFIEMKGISDGGDSRRFTISDGSIDNRVSLEYDESAGRIKAFLSTGGTTTGALDESGHTQTENHKIALTYTASVFKIFIDGVLEGQDTSLTGTPVGLSRIEFASGSGNNPMEGLIKQSLVFKTALTDAECIALTTI